MFKLESNSFPRCGNWTVVQKRRALYLSRMTYYSSLDLSTTIVPCTYWIYDPGSSLRK
uniref:Uncharacterized protein n=1 Tax=Setaria italica TaxID=4555 RepID=K3Z239_SETIT